MAGLMGGIGAGLSNFMDSFNQTKQINTQRDAQKAQQQRYTLQDIQAANKLKAEQEQLAQLNQKQQATSTLGGLMAQGINPQDALMQLSNDPSFNPANVDYEKIASISKSMAPKIEIVEVDGKQMAYNPITGEKKFLGAATPKGDSKMSFDLAIGPDGNQFYIEQGGEVPEGARIIKKGEAGGSGPDVKNEGALRKEFNAGAKDFKTITDAYGTIHSLAKQESAGGDLGLIFATMKMFDPTSTVREGEFATAQNAAGVPERIQNQWNQLKSGERLNPKQRADFVRTAESVYADRQNRFRNHVQRYTDIAKSYNFAPERIIADFGENKDELKPKTTPEPAMMMGDGSQDLGGISQAAKDLINKYKVQ